MDLDVSAQGKTKTVSPVSRTTQEDFVRFRKHYGTNGRNKFTINQYNAEIKEVYCMLDGLMHKCAFSKRECSTNEQTDNCENALRNCDPAEQEMGNASSCGDEVKKERPSKQHRRVVGCKIDMWWATKCPVCKENHTCPCDKICLKRDKMQQCTREELMDMVSCLKKEVCESKNMYSRVRHHEMVERQRLMGACKERSMLDKSVDKKKNEYVTDIEKQFKCIDEKLNNLENLIDCMKSTVSSQKSSSACDRFCAVCKSDIDASDGNGCKCNAAAVRKSRSDKCASDLPPPCTCENDPLTFMDIVLEFYCWLFPDSTCGAPSVVEYLKSMLLGLLMCLVPDEYWNHASECADKYGSIEGNNDVRISHSKNINNDLDCVPALLVTKKDVVVASCHGFVNCNMFERLRKHKIHEKC